MRIKNIDDKTVDYKTASKLLGISINTLYKYVQDEKVLKAKAPGWRARIPIAEINRIRSSRNRH